MKKTLLTLGLFMTTLTLFGQKYGGGLHVSEKGAIQMEMMKTKNNFIYGGGILFGSSGPGAEHYSSLAGPIGGDPKVGTQTSKFGFSGIFGHKLTKTSDGNIFVIVEPAIVENTKTPVYKDPTGILGSKYTTSKSYGEFDTYFQGGVLIETENNYIKVVGGLSIYGETIFGITIGI